MSVLLRITFSLSVLCCVLFWPLNVCFAELKTFNRDSLKYMLREKSAEPWLLVLWSVDCAPCYKELALLKKLEAVAIKIVLLATDPPEQRTDVQRVLAGQGLAAFDTWQYGGGNAAALRYAIDPQWHGELPRNYFYRPDGKVCAESGALTLLQLEQWLAGSADHCGFP